MEHRFEPLSVKGHYIDYRYEKNIEHLNNHTILLIQHKTCVYIYIRDAKTAIHKHVIVKGEYK